MTTTLFAIFGIALLATLAWVITRIVNIFEELEEVNEQAVYLRDDIEALEEKTKELEKKLIDLERKVFANTQAQALIVEHQGKVDELIAKAAEGDKKTSECLHLLAERQTSIEDVQKSLNGAFDVMTAFLDDMRAKANRKSEAHKEKMDRVAKYIVLRGQGLSIRKAGEEVGVAYVTAKRYERIRKETKQWG
jgi:chromosome segregation ATPase